jgi:hypothetical protein
LKQEIYSFNIMILLEVITEFVVSWTAMIAFMKSVMPSFCEIFSKNPQKMMTEMMPLCREMMKACNMDMQGMMKMMGMMGKNSA